MAAKALEHDAPRGYLDLMAGKMKMMGKARAKGAKMRIKDAGGARVEFGNVVVEGPKPSKELLAHNVKLGSDSLKRAAASITRPGVSLRAKKGVPHFFADSDRPGVYLRKLDGKVDRGRLVDGVFLVID